MMYCASYRKRRNSRAGTLCPQFVDVNLTLSLQVIYFKFYLSPEGGPRNVFSDNEELRSTLE